MDDLISRKAALDALLQCRKHCIDPFDSYHIDIEDAEARIRGVPAVPQEPFTYYGYGECVSSEEAIEIFQARMPENRKDAEKYQRAINRFIYLAERLQPVKPKFHKGQYGKKYDSYTCGSCGTTLSIIHKWCYNCGCAVDWRVK